MDTDLPGDVGDELYWDPKVDNGAIAVSADDDKITLRGTVGSLREKREAQKAAQRVYGVVSVDNQLQVKLMNDDKRADADLRSDVLQALMLDSLVPKTVDATVDDGFRHAHWDYGLAVRARRVGGGCLEHRRHARRLRRDPAQAPDA